ncbi:uracil permease [Spirochaetia bacterium]|nr:uracil permease [Spirochaetia bacterium]
MKPIYDVEERPPFTKSLFYGLQHLLACFGATVLVPMLVGINPLYALFSAGIGTLLYLFITKFKVPNFVGSSFAFIGCAIMVLKTYGPEYLAGGAIVSAVFYTLIALLVWKAGSGWINKVLPPVVIGPVVAVIGLSLAGTAISMSGAAEGGDFVAMLLALATLAITIIAMFFKNKFVSSISIVIGLAGGYLLSAIFGRVDYSAIVAAPIINLPTFVVPKFNGTVILVFALVSFATICEHIGHTMVTGQIINRDVVKNPGLHRTILGDGLATGIAGLFGSVANTTYGESLGVMATTKVFSVFVFIFSGALAIVLSIFGKLGGVLQTIPAHVLGGLCILLYGTIAVNGLKQLVVNKVDFDKTRNLIIASVIFILGCGGSVFQLPGSAYPLLTSIAFAAIVGIILNLVLPKDKEEAAEELSKTVD